MALGATRTVAATATLILIVFVICFLLVSYSRLSPSSDNSGRSRHTHIVRRDFKADNSQRFGRHRHVVQRVVAPRGSRTGVQGPYDAPHFRTKPSVGGEGTASNASATKTNRSTPIDAGSKYRKAHNVSHRLDFRSQNRNRKSNETRKFGRQLTRSERATLLTMFGSTARALRAGNVTFWMDGGTLLGSYRHHGLIPWDDDVDLVLHRSHKRRARLAVQSLAPAYQLYVEKDAAGQAELAWRVFATNASVPVTRNDRVRFPTVDLHFYAANATHVWLEPRKLWWWLVWRRRTVFPLHLRPFAKYWAPAPCDTPTYLVAEYDAEVLETCRSPRTSHRRNVGQRQASLPCSLLHRLPLVSRKQDGVTGRVSETLVRAGKTVHQRVIRRKC